MVGGRSGVTLLARARLNNIDYEEYRANILLLPNFTFVKKLKNKYVSPELKQKIKKKRYCSLSYSDREKIKQLTGLRGAELNDYIVDIGMKKILNNFKKHLELIPLVSLNGIVKTEGAYGFHKSKNDLRYQTVFQNYYNLDISNLNCPVSRLTNLIIYIISFGTFIFCFLYNKWGLFWFLLPFVYCFAMYAFLTAFASRYFYHFIPILIVATVIFVSKMFLLLKQMFMNLYNSSNN